MGINTLTGIKIAGVAAAVPCKSTTPEDYIEILGEAAVDSFKKASGVRKRHILVPVKENGDMTVWQTAGDLACAAARKLLEEKGIGRDEVGAVVLVTQSADYKAPCTACVIQSRLGLSPDCIAFDVTLGCSGYGYGIVIAASLMQSSDMKYALVLAADGNAGWSELNKTFCANMLLMGDAGTATLLERDENAEPLVIFTRTDGDGFNKTGMLWGCRRPFAPAGAHFMDDIDVFNYITTQGPAIINAYMDYMHTTPEDYDLFVLHQASMFSLKQLSRRIKVKMDKIPLSLCEYGNTGPATIPLTLCTALGDTQEEQVQNVLLSGFGVGLSAAAFSAKIDAADVLPVFETDEWFDDGLV